MDFSDRGQYPAVRANGVDFGSLKKNACWWKTAVFGCVFSLCIEVCQLAFKLGLFEFDDILNNTIGMMVGYGLWRLIEYKRVKSIGKRNTDR